MSGISCAMKVAETVKPATWTKVVKTVGSIKPAAVKKSVSTKKFAKLANVATNVSLEEAEKAVAKMPKVTFEQYVLGRFSKEQIEVFNKYRLLPKNLKISMDKNGNPELCWNFFGITNGTRQIPEGWVFRNDAFGFTHVDWAKYKAVYDKTGKVVYVPDIDSCYS